ncbi:MAG: formylglycine-generating enzyme family protein [Leptolyngbya sp. SIOISBB]|nr:formylglycine-generating enzyme family protein [Leptolyngbya sp. SIOISBB]
MATPQANSPRIAINKRKEQRPCFDEPLGESLTLRMMQIPAGTFMMGSPEDEPERLGNEGLQHEVTVPSLFMGKYPVTQAQWRFVAALDKLDRDLKPEPSRFKGDMRPVERVGWYEAFEFCERLSRHTKRQYRLPSEAEWEYACRAGTTTPFHFGETITTDLANYNGTDEEYGAYGRGPKGEYRGETTAVDYFGVANAWGLCDLHGNVYEWCQDHWHDNYDGAPTDGSAWLTDEEGARRVIRGGSWDDSPRYCRSAYRNFSIPGDRSNLIGFRVVCSAPRT